MTAPPFVRDAVGLFAREVMENRIPLPGRDAAPAELPAPVRAARDFYLGALTGDGDCFGEVLLRALPADAGAGFLLIGYQVERQWGTAEVYDAGGGFVAAAVLVAGATAWHDLDAVRGVVGEIDSPVGLIPKAAELEWISQGPEACVSVGGRFSVTPPDPAATPPRFAVYDGLTRREHAAETFAAARAMAARLHAEG